MIIHYFPPKAEIGNHPNKWSGYRFKTYKRNYVFIQCKIKF